MIRPIVLDAGPLGKIAHPRPNKEFANWFRQMLEAGAQFVVSEVTDYEVRRSFILHDLTESIEHLNKLEETLTYLPLSTLLMRRAAQLWAQARKEHKPTADPKELDCDVILAAQALEIDAIVATENIGHLSRFVEAKHWKDITISDILIQGEEKVLETDSLIENYKELESIFEENLNKSITAKNRIDQAYIEINNAINKRIRFVESLGTPEERVKFRAQVDTFLKNLVPDLHRFAETLEAESKQMEQHNREALNAGACFVTTGFSSPLGLMVVRLFINKTGFIVESLQSWIRLFNTYSKGFETTDKDDPELEEACQRVVLAIGKLDQTVNNIIRTCNEVINVAEQFIRESITSIYEPLKIIEEHEQIIKILAGEDYIPKVRIIRDKQGFLFSQWATVLPEGTKASVLLGRYYLTDEPEGQSIKNLAFLDYEDVKVIQGHFIHEKPLTNSGEIVGEGKYFLELQIITDETWEQPEEVYHAFDIIREFLPAIEKIDATETKQVQELNDKETTISNYKLLLKVDFDLPVLK